jgi:hypothetical protein
MMHQLKHLCSIWLNPTYERGVYHKNGLIKLWLLIIVSTGTVPMNKIDRKEIQVFLKIEKPVKEFLTGIE